MIEVVVHPPNSLTSRQWGHHLHPSIPQRLTLTMCQSIPPDSSYKIDGEVFFHASTCDQYPPGSSFSVTSN